MRRVCPGLEEVRAKEVLLRVALRSDDLPTLDRPRKATWCFLNEEGFDVSKYP